MMKWWQDVSQDAGRAPPNWDEIEKSFPYAADMRACMQDPVHHAEGDVWTHTKMVAQETERSKLHRANPLTLRLIALFHDVAKPQTRTAEWDASAGREIIRHPKHARLGAQTAWFEMYKAGIPRHLRTRVYWVCMLHQKVFHVWDYEDMDRLVLQFMCASDWNFLIEFARADNRGRHCVNPEVAENNLLLLDEYRSEEVLPHWTAMDRWSRFFYFEKEGRSFHHKAQRPAGSTVYVMSGLPGSGKDTFIKNHLPGMAVVSMDEIRQAMGVLPTDNQGRVAQAALEQARVYLRAKTNFVWNTTGLTRMMRSKIVSLARDYDGDVRMVACCAPLDVLLRQNRERERVVPEKVILDLARKWEPVSHLECHSLTWVDTGYVSGDTLYG